MNQFKIGIRRKCLYIWMVWYDYATTLENSKLDLGYWILLFHNWTDSPWYMTSPQNLHTGEYLIFKVLQTLVNPKQQPTDNQSTTSLQIVYNLSLPLLPPLYSGIVSAGRLGFSAKPTRQSPFPICLKYANPAYLSLTIWDTLWLRWREHKWDAGRCSNFINAIQCKDTHIW